MANHVSRFVFFVVVVSSSCLANGALEQRDMLRRFVQSTAARLAVARDDGPDEEHERGAGPWSYPLRSFAHLPRRCKSPPEGSKAADRVAALPGQPPRVNFGQYAGYVTVDERHGRALFYYFVESPYGAASKPLVLWLNGGPGCSSLGAGAMTELGPFRVNPDGKTLSRNKHAWNNVANVIFLESPAGVGFSYSNTSSDYDESGDTRTAIDAYIFLLNWLERYPEYRGRDFYIAGESYGGHYVPQLATVVQALRELFGQDDVNLKGIFVGNPYLDYYKNTKGSLEYLWNHGVISDEVWANIIESCSFDSSDGRRCEEAKNSFNAGNIDPYHIYAPLCIRAQNGSLLSTSYLPGYDPCIQYYVPVYFNRPEVQKAMHARTSTPWTTCVDLPWNDAPLSMVSTISWLVENGVRVWLYSGDMDDVCPITATRYSVKDLNLTVTKPWRPWYYPDNEVGGYAQQYEGGFTLATVRGSGHLVPSFQPKRSLVLFYSFMKGLLPPEVSVWRP